MSYTDYQFTTQVSKTWRFSFTTHTQKTNETPLNNRFYNVYISKSTFSIHMAKSVINKISQWLSHDRFITTIERYCNDIHVMTYTIHLSCDRALAVLFKCWLERFSSQRDALGHHPPRVCTHLPDLRHVSSVGSITIRYANLRQKAIKV